MSNIDKQRVAAVRKLEALGYRYEGDEWVGPTVTNQSILAEADAILSALVLRADALEGCIEGSEEEAELAVITDADRGLRSGTLASGQGAGRERVVDSAPSGRPQSVSCQYNLTQSLHHRLFPVPMVPRRA